MARKVTRMSLEGGCLFFEDGSEVSGVSVELLKVLPELKKAFCDVLDGNYQPYEIQAQTGMTMERCEEISNLFKRLVQS